MTQGDQPTVSGGRRACLGLAAFALVISGYVTLYKSTTSGPVAYENRYEITVTDRDGNPLDVPQAGVNGAPAGGAGATGAVTGVMKETWTRGLPLFTLRKPASIPLRLYLTDEGRARKTEFIDIRINPYSETATMARVLQLEYQPGLFSPATDKQMVRHDVRFDDVAEITDVKAAPGEHRALGWDIRLTVRLTPEQVAMLLDGTAPPGRADVLEKENRQKTE